MANGSAGLGTLGGFVDKRKGNLQTAVSVSTPANFASVSAMRTRLAAVNGTYYTSARLDQMTANDMTYALLQLDEAAGKNW
jgi:hypothetical protein